MNPSSSHDIQPSSGAFSDPANSKLPSSKDQSFTGTKIVGGDIRNAVWPIPALMNWEHRGADTLYRILFSPNCWLANQTLCLPTLNEVIRTDNGEAKKHYENNRLIHLYSCDPELQQRISALLQRQWESTDWTSHVPPLLARIFDPKTFKPVPAFTDETVDRLRLSVIVTLAQGKEFYAALDCAQYPRYFKCSRPRKDEMVFNGDKQISPLYQSPSGKVASEMMLRATQILFRVTMLQDLCEIVRVPRDLDWLFKIALEMRDDWDLKGPRELRNLIELSDLIDQDPTRSLGSSREDLIIQYLSSSKALKRYAQDNAQIQSSPNVSTMPLGKQDESILERDANRQIISGLLQEKFGECAELTRKVMKFHSKRGVTMNALQTTIQTVATPEQLLLLLLETSRVSRAPEPASKTIVETTEGFHGSEITETAGRTLVCDKPKFDAWVATLHPQHAAMLIAKLERLSEGFMGSTTRLQTSESLSEFRINVGPGYRVYFTRDGETITILSWGNKASQQRDIERALKIANSPDLFARVEPLRAPGIVSES